MLLNHCPILFKPAKDTENPQPVGQETEVVGSVLEAKWRVPKRGKISNRMPSKGQGRVLRLANGIE